MQEIGRELADGHPVPDRATGHWQKSTVTMPPSGPDGNCADPEVAGGAHSAVHSPVAITRNRPVDTGTVAPCTHARSVCVCVRGMSVCGDSGRGGEGRRSRADVWRVAERLRKQIGRLDNIADQHGTPGSKGCSAQRGVFFNSVWHENSRLIPWPLTGLTGTAGLNVLEPERGVSGLEELRHEPAGTHLVDAARPRVDNVTAAGVMARAHAPPPEAAGSTTLQHPATANGKRRRQRPCHTTLLVRRRGRTVHGPRSHRAAARR